LELVEGEIIVLECEVCVTVKGPKKGIDFSIKIPPCLSSFNPEIHSALQICLPPFRYFFFAPKKLFTPLLTKPIQTIPPPFRDSFH
jgi:hypothetical protein